jgi:hypothetical protein
MLFSEYPWCIITQVLGAVVLKEENTQVKDS